MPDSSPASIQAQKIPRILILRLSAHGDVILTLPLLARLKELWPEAELHWLVGRPAASLLEGHPNIHRLWVVEKSTFKSIKEAWTLVKELKAAHFDLAMDVQGLWKSALWPWLAGIPIRLGFQPSREPVDSFYTHKVQTLPPKQSTRHVSEEWLRLLEPLMELFPLDSRSSEALGDALLSYPLPVWSVSDEQRLATLPGWSKILNPESRVYVFAPATTWPSKHWSVSHWADLLKQLIEAQDLLVVFIGAPDNEAYIQSILTQAHLERGQSERVLNWSGKTSLRDLYGIFAQVDAVVGPDSAPLHIANAVSMQPEQRARPKVLGLYGPTRSSRTGPYAPWNQALQLELPCQPCHQRECALKEEQHLACFKQLTSTQVLEALKAL